MFILKICSKTYKHGITIGLHVTGVTELIFLENGY